MAERHPLSTKRVKLQVSIYITNTAIQVEMCGNPLLVSGETIGKKGGIATYAITGECKILVIENQLSITVANTIIEGERGRMRLATVRFTGSGQNPTRIYTYMCAGRPKIA